MLVDEEEHGEKQACFVMKAGLVRLFLFAGIERSNGFGSLDGIVDESHILIFCFHIPCSGIIALV